MLSDGALGMAAARRVVLQVVPLLCRNLVLRLLFGLALRLLPPVVS